jgi:hypothetical protein
MLQACSKDGSLTGMRRRSEATPLSLVAGGWVEMGGGGGGWQSAQIACIFNPQKARKYDCILSLH